MATGGVRERKITSAVYDGEISVMMKRRRPRWWWRRGRVRKEVRLSGEGRNRWVVEERKRENEREVEERKTDLEGWCRRGRLSRWVKKR